MKTIGALILASMTIARATTIELDLGPPGIRSDQEIIAFSSLNGKALSGQSLTLDYVFANDEFVRILSSTTKTFDVAVTFLTNASGFLNDAGGSAFVVDSAGNSISATFTFGGGSVSGGDNLPLLAGYVFPMLDKNGTPRTDVTTLDFYGAHFDLILPNVPGVEITGARFGMFATAAHPWKARFAVGPHVTESGSTIAMLFCAFAACVALRTRVRSSCS
jgi:hypothetical protein